jgi:hypothetical protein
MCWYSGLRADAAQGTRGPEWLEVCAISFSKIVVLIFNRWIFIIEGALTVFLGIVAYWALVDFPDKAHTSWHFLNEREAKFIIDAVNRDRGDAKMEPWNLKKFLRGGADIKIWGFAMVSISVTEHDMFTDQCRSSSTPLPLPMRSHTSSPLF